ncbi:NAD(P)/FAD-dependent oxidoreductase [Nitriliruptor alkaliphilus]|uniref:NAD(P)/FAD-dependent oxidoreductase n=1 Tax=Nitriliruptor alkaliphilus TaxID=427918 RepID=UPI0009FAE7AD|nr:NAD(P)/FAD-dependent oxidoreductase [Nitriliruptor alkaliphilus]
MPPTDRYDAIVVGARVAGASTAMLLARSGLRVLVVDRDRYGSDTLSTHALMRGGVLQLSRWGLLDELVAAGTPPVHRTVLRYGTTEETVEVQPGPHVPALFAPRRTVLDRLLVDAAVRAGAEVRFRTCLTDLLRDDDGRVVGIEARGEDGERWTATAPVTIGADGIRSLVARQVGAGTYAAGVHASAMVVGHWSGVDVDGYHVRYGPGAAAGLIPTNDGRACCWVATPAAGFTDQRREPALGMTGVLGVLAPDWADALDAGVRHGPIRGFAGVPGYLRQPWGRGWALVGDAGFFKDPLTTHGMTDALRDAELLARAVVGAAGSARALDAALAGYHDTRDRFAGELLRLSDAIAAYDWEPGELRGMFLDVSAAVRPELTHLLGLDAPTEADVLTAGAGAGGRGRGGAA